MDEIERNDDDRTAYNGETAEGGENTGYEANERLGDNTSSHARREDSNGALPPAQPPQGGPDSKPTAKYYIVRFEGSAGEYFRIWIVNLFLTIITFGIYGAWAKVRTRRYFYSRTLLDGHPFEYLANPIAILRGNLIVAGLFFAYTLTNQLMPIISIFILLAFYCVFPLLVHKTLRFNARNSSYRNIRFNFQGGLKESYRIYLFIPMLAPLTFGLIIPYWAFRRKEYFFRHFSYGSGKNRFSGMAEQFYKFYGMAFLLFIGFGLIVGAGAAGVTATYFASTINAGGPVQGPKEVFDPTKFMMIFFAMYVGAILVGSILQQYLYTRMTNYCWGRTKVGVLRFKSAIKARSLIWIRLTNLLAIIFSFGLLAPWARVRRTRYICESLTVGTWQGLEEFAAAVDSEVSAVGDSATEFFDFEVGL